MVQENPWLHSSPQPPSQSGWHTWVPPEDYGASRITTLKPTTTQPDTETSPWIQAALDATTEPNDPDTETLSLTGANNPQPLVDSPRDGLPLRKATAAASLWVVGAHGGAGESSIAELVPTWRAANQAWPQTLTPHAAPCVMAARTNAAGLLAARAALTQWASSSAGHIKLLGVVFIADAPGELPTALKDLVKVVGGDAPRVWEIPWNESWRTGKPVTDHIPRPVSKLVRQIESLITEPQPKE